MAQMFNGQGFQVNQQLGGTNLAMGYWGNSKQDNPINNLQNLIGNLQYTHQYRGLMDNINPYDGLTAAQKMQQQGIYNDYSINYMDKLAAAYNAEAESMRAARQTASDFNAEAILAEAHRVRASGDPRQIQAFNNKIARYINAQVASGALTPETAQKAYVDYNTPLTERSNVALLNAQARSTNANALGRELANQDYLMEQKSLNDAYTLYSQQIPVTDESSAVAVGKALGWNYARTMAAFNSGKIQRYRDQFGSFAEQTGKINTDVFLNGVPLSNSNIPIAATQSKATGAVESKPNVINNATGVPDSKNILDNASTPVKGVGILNAEALEAEANKGNQNNQSNTAAQLTVSGSGQQPQQVAQNNIGNTATVTPTGTASAPIPATQKEVPADSTQQNTATPVTGQDLKQDNTTPVSTTEQANTLNNAVEQANINNGNPIVKTGTNGSKYLDISNSAIYDPKTGSWSFNENIPLDQVSAFDTKTVDANLVNLNRETGGALPDIFELGKDASGNIILKPTANAQKELDTGDPNIIAKYKALENDLYQAFSPLFTANNLPAAVNFMQAYLGNSKEARDAAKANLDSLLTNTKNSAMTDALNNKFDSQYSLRGVIGNMKNVRQNSIRGLSNLAQTSKGMAGNQNFLLEVFKTNPTATAATLSTLVSQGTSGLETIKKDVKTAENYLAAAESTMGLADLSKQYGGSVSNLLPKLKDIEDEGTKAVYQSLIDYGVIIGFTETKDAENAKGQRELIAETTAEYATSLQALANDLQTKYGLSLPVAQAIAIRAGIIPERNVINHWFPAISDTNNPQFLNVEEAYRLAGLVNSYFISPKGKVLYEQQVESIKNANKAIASFETRSTELTEALTTYGNIPATAKANGIPVMEIEDENGNITYSLQTSDVSNKGSNSILFSNEGTKATKDAVTGLNKALTVYLGAWDVVNSIVRPISEQNAVNDAKDEFFRSESLNLNSVEESNKQKSNDAYSTDFGLMPPPTALSAGIAYTDYLNPPSQIPANTKNIRKALENYTPKNPIPVNANDLNPNTSTPIPTNTNTNTNTNTSTSNRDTPTDANTIETFTPPSIDNTIPPLDELNKKGYTSFVKGRDYEQNNQPNLAYNNYQEAFKQGNVEAAYRLGTMYVEGNGVKQNYDTALKYYKSAAEKGHPDAMLAIGHMYYKGVGVKRNRDLGRKWFVAAAKLQGYNEDTDKGNFSVMPSDMSTFPNFDGIYINRNRVSVQDLKDAYQYKEKNKTNPNLKFLRLGYMYRDGENGVDRDYAQSFKWFKHAADNDKNNVIAQTNLGDFYNKGLGVKQDAKQAFTWYTKAAEQGSPVAQYNIGLMYMQGRGTNKDLTLAEKWLKAAAKHGYSEAKTALKKLQKQKE